MSQLASIGTALSLAAAALPALSPNKAEAAALPSVRPGEILVRDTGSNSSFLGPNFFSNFFENSPSNSTIAAASFIGNGELVSRIGGFFVKAGPDSAINGGSWSDYTFRIGFHESPERFRADPFLIDPTAAERAIIFASPTNSGWSTPVTSINGNQVFYLEFDLSNRGIRTISGKTQLFSINPDGASIFGSSGQMFAAGGNLSGSDFFGTGIRGGRTGTFQEVGFPSQSAAAFATTMPEPTSAGFLLLGLSIWAGSARLRSGKVNCTDRDGPVR